MSHVFKLKTIVNHIALTFVHNNTCLWAAGGVCPPLDPDVLPVPCCPLLHHLVSPLPSLH